MKIIDYTGKRIGILTVVKRTDKLKYERKSRVYVCLCDCGKTKELSTAEFSSAKSCGCLFKQNKQKFKTMNTNKRPKWALPIGESSINALIGRYKNSAKKRKIGFDLIREHFIILISSNCFYCGTKPYQLFKHTNRLNATITYIGIDRKDNKIGYSKENCVSCCQRCNRAKDIMTIKKFKEWITSVYNHTIRS